MKHLNYKNIDYIIKEYLGLSDEYISLIDIDMLKQDIKYIINKYSNIDYMLASDFELGFASDNFDRNNKTYKDIIVLENKNGIIVYRKVGLI